MRVLIYSHDSFGLGHLRRCRVIAHQMVKARDDLSVIIISGSPIIGSFDFLPRVDFIRVPGVMKLKDGNYSPTTLDMNIQETMTLRGEVILHTALSFKPDIFLVDKEPLGLRGEIETTLLAMKRAGTRNIIGLRDVMDDPGLLAKEWKRKGSMEALEKYYDDIWIYGPSEMGHPLDGLDMPDNVREKSSFTGYFNRKTTEPDLSDHRFQHVIDKRDYLLVTTGGGGDGSDMIDWVLSSIEYSKQLQKKDIILVTGPFMSQQTRQMVKERCAILDNVYVLTFDNYMERLLSNARAIVAMGGYNTMSEIMSYNKPALIIPRTHPRKEQLIRAQKASVLRMTDYINPENKDETEPVFLSKKLEKTLEDATRPQIPSTFFTGLDFIENWICEQ